MNSVGQIDKEEKLINTLEILKQKITYTRKINRNIGLPPKVVGLFREELHFQTA